MPSGVMSGIAANFSRIVGERAQSWQMGTIRHPVADTSLIAWPLMTTSLLHSTHGANAHNPLPSVLALRGSEVRHAMIYM
jgi:hypothetical protein